MTRAVWQTVGAMTPGRPLLGLDRVGQQESDDIDAGTPLVDERAALLSVKTLVFYS